MRALMLSVLLWSSASFAWGFDGHRRLASLMQDALPPDHCLRAWLAARQTTQLQDHACDPDRWRSTDRLEAPRHFLEIDWVMPLTNYPRDFAAVEALLGAGNASGNGVVPWRVEEKYAELVAAFRANDPAAILDVAFAMSHYVFYSCSVLHDTKNFDPNNGLHARWESDMLNVSAHINGVTTLAQTYYGTAGLADPRNNIFDLVITGNALVDPLIAADTAAARSIPALYSSTRDLTARRWGDGITVMSSMLWSAWAEAGKPELSGFSPSCSRAVPMSDIVIRGYPPVGGFFHAADGGYPFTSVDGGLEDAGTGGGAGGGSGGGGGEQVNPPACGCSANAAPVLLGMCGLLVLARRRRS